MKFLIAFMLLASTLFAQCHDRPYRRHVRNYRYNPIVHRVIPTRPRPPCVSRVVVVHTHTGMRTVPIITIPVRTVGCRPIRVITVPIR